MKLLPKFVSGWLPFLYLASYPIITLIFVRCVQQSCTKSDLKGCNALYWTLQFAAPSSLIGVAICNLIESRQSVPFAPHTCTGVSLASGSLAAGIFATKTYDDDVWTWNKEQVQDKWSKLTSTTVVVANSNAAREVALITTGFSTLLWSICSIIEGCLDNPQDYPDCRVISAAAGVLVGVGWTYKTSGDSLWPWTQNGSQEKLADEVGFDPGPVNARLEL